MGWLRSRMRLGAWTAAFVLVAQLVLSFGHVHGLADGRPCAVSTLALDKADACARQHDANHNDDYCAICAVLAMLSGAQTASAPIIPVHFVGAWTEQTASPDSVLPDRAHIAFRSRAPPQA
jgi:hypothetical protein